MKKKITLLFVLVSLISFSQKTKNDTNIKENSDEEITYFWAIEKSPIYPGCEGDNATLKKCFQEKMTRYVRQKFNVDLGSELGLKPGKKRIDVSFIINKKGLIENITVHAPNIELKKETERVIKLLPQMEAGKSNGKKVSCMYHLPILFYIEEYISPDTKRENEIFLYHNTDKRPVPRGCKNDKSTLQNCTKKKIRIYLSKKIKKKFLKKLDINVDEESFFIQFIIDKKGYITDINALIVSWIGSTESCNRLEQEIIHALESFPPMKPGEYKGTKVRVLFDLSININFRKGKINRKKN